MDWKKLDDEIDYWRSMLFSTMERDHWRRFWAKSKEIGAAFKAVRYPTKEDKNEAWRRYSEFREQASARADRERQERELKSKSHRDAIISKAEDARPYDGILDALPPNTSMADKLKAFGPLLREAGQMLKRRKHEMLGHHKKECFERIQEVREVHDLYWEQIKRERTRRHEAWVDRTRENIRKNYDRIERLRSVLHGKRDHASRLRSEIASAWNADWAARREGWLAEEESAIAEIEEKISQIEGWIAEDEAKLYR